jgi:DNA polymerase zeta
LQVLQPHYSHVPYILQFMMDYNLQGMNLLNLRFAKFRRKNATSATIEHERLEDSSSSQEESLRTTDKLKRIFSESNLPSYLLMPETVPPVPSCELEIDGVAADILNTNSSLLSTSMLTGAATRFVFLFSQR